jgi:hypothetical protein
VAAGRTFILNVVVDQGEIVEQLDRRGDGRGGRGVAAGGAGSQHCHRRADPFAAVDGRRVDRVEVGVCVAEVIADHAREQWGSPIE